MRFFQQRHRSTFWSQLFLGLVAILALPSNTSGIADIEQSYVAEQKILTLSELSAIKKAEQVAQYLESPTILPTSLLQAVIFCEFFAKPYRLLSASKPPIRAGPYNIAI